MHQSIVSLTKGYSSEDWVKPVDEYKDDRKSMTTLEVHFSGEENATRRVREADRMKEMIHY